MNDRPSRYRPPFPPGRTERCFCGSGQRFKHCCGRTDPQRPPPHGIHIIEQFLPVEACRDWVRFAERQPSERLKVIERDPTQPDRMIRRFDNRRVTERVNPGSRGPALTALIRRIWTEVIAPDVGRRFAWFEAPQILKYSPGGFYQAHSDSDSYEAETGRWRHDLDRDISLLLYLNDEFSGGDLSFEYLDYRIRPRPGMLVWFPSDARYYHGANPVIDGTRYAIVSWAAFADTPKVRNELPRLAVVLDSC